MKSREAQTVKSPQGTTAKTAKPQKLPPTIGVTDHKAVIVCNVFPKLKP